MSQPTKHPLKLLNDLLTQEVEEHEKEYGHILHVLFYFEMSDETLKALLAKSPFFEGCFKITITNETTSFYNRAYTPKEKLCGVFYGRFQGFVSQHNEHPRGKVILRKGFDRVLEKKKEK